jgi:nucleoside-diphosphate-sugar epimerase
MKDLHVVIGSGTIGGRLAKFLAANGRRVVVLSRSAAIQTIPGVEQKIADATSVEALLSVAPKAKTVYNCANPDYTKWETEWPKLSAAVNEFAMRAGADLVICSNLYGYGPYDGVLTEDVPLNATWVNGRARARVWEEAKALNDSGNLRVTEVRGSDYICPNEQSRMGHRVVPNLLLGKPVQLLGALDQPHTWTDPDNVALLMMAVADDDRSWGKPWHVPSNSPKTQREVVADIAATLHVTNYRISPVGKAMEGVLGIFNPLIRALNKGAYQFDKPFVMSSDAASEAFGLKAKSWNRVIEDLVWPYTEYSEKNGKEVLAKLVGVRLPEKTL